MTEVFVSGRSPSELYFEKKVIQEFIILTLVSGFLCFLFLFITKNLKLVVLTVFSVIASIVVSLGFSSFVWRIELVMIITPAILFIVCLSDIMHLTNKQSNVTSSKECFLSNENGYGWQGCCFNFYNHSYELFDIFGNDIVPILRFGLITSVGVVLHFLLLCWFMP